MSPKMLELKERIKLNAEYTKLSNLKQLSNEQEIRYKELRELFFTKSGSWFDRTPLYIINRRIHHIAYSMLKGRTYEQIENKVRPENELNKNDWGKIHKIMKEVEDNA